MSFLWRIKLAQFKISIFSASSTSREKSGKLLLWILQNRGIVLLVKIFVKITTLCPMDILFTDSSYQSFTLETLSTLHNFRAGNIGFLVHKSPCS